MSLTLDVEAYTKAPVDSPDGLQAVQRIGKAIDSGDATLLNVVEELGQQLTHTDPFVRAKGVGLLSAVLREIRKDRIGHDAASVLINFFLERLEDQPSVGEALKGMRALLEAGVLSNSDALRIPTAIFTELAVQTFQQTVRHSVFVMLDYLLDRNLAGVKSLGPDFVSGYIQTMDGEKDPRNLLLAFRGVKKIVDNLDYEKYTEDLFEVTFCYFPITFRPPPDDIYGITAEDLKVALRTCICATPKFAKFAMPVLVEKLSSSSGTAKRDAMETLAACAPIYGGRPLLPHAEHIWDFLKEEIFKGVNDANETAALDAIRAVTLTLSATTATSTDKKEPLEVFLGLAIKDTVDNLKEPELKYAKSSGRMLQAAAMACDPACHIIINAAVPVLMEQYKVDDAPTRRKTVLEVLLDFVKAGREVYGSIGSSDMEVDEDFETPLLAYKDRLFYLFIAALTSKNDYPPLRLFGARGLREVLMSRYLLGGSEVRDAVQIMTQAVLDEADEEVRGEALLALVEFSAQRPGTVLQTTFVTLFDELPNEGWVSEASMDKVNTALGAIIELSMEPTLFRQGLQLLLEKLDPTAVKVTATVEDVAYARALASAMLAILEKRSEYQRANGNAENVVAECKDTLVAPLLERAVSAAKAEASVFRDAGVVDTIARVLGVVVRSWGVNEQKVALDYFFHAFLSGGEEQNFKPLLVGPRLGVYPETLAHRRSVGDFVRGAETDIATFRGRVVQLSSSVADVNTFLAELVCQPWTNSTGVLVAAAGKAAASVLNKLKSDGDVSKFVDDVVVPHVRTKLLDPSLEAETRYCLLSTYLWITKALVLRSHPMGYDMSQDLVALLADPVLGRRAADGFGIVVGDSPDGVLTKASFAVLRLLYKQKFFNHCVPRLVEGFHAAPNDLKQYYLMVLSHLLRNIPQQILLSELPKLFPLLLSSLSFPEADLKIATLDTLSLVLSEAPMIAADHVGSIVDALLKMATARGGENGNTIKARVAALKVLGQLAKSVEFSILYPQKQRVLKQLGGAVDDPKRLVRKEAVNSRMKWYLLLGPKEK
ncbi:mms19 nucleotide excision repair [Borealophlyctis nickersoniae]|nr:mms19 nucleotide excision repair [Borealophlyctis nickersoniae]